MASRNEPDKISELEVCNWEKYNPRGDSSRPSWFRMENNIATGDAFFGLDCEQKWLWVFILSLVSQRNGKSILWNAAYCTAMTGIAENKQTETIGIFEKYGRLRVTRARPVRDEPATNERTNVTKRTDETDERVAEKQKTLFSEPSGTASEPRKKKSRSRKGVNPEDIALTTPTWEAYSQAYADRYGHPPTRDAKTNSCLKKFIEAIGKEDAPHVAKFYLSHNKAFYVGRHHAVEILGYDAQALRVQWKTGNKILGTQAREIERTQHNAEVWDRAAQRVNAAIERSSK